MPYRDFPGWLKLVTVVLTLVALWALYRGIAWGMGRLSVAGQFTVGGIVIALLVFGFAAGLLNERSAKAEAARRAYEATGVYDVPPKRRPAWPRILRWVSIYFAAAFGLIAVVPILEGYAPAWAYLVAPVCLAIVGFVAVRGVRRRFAKPPLLYAGSDARRADDIRALKNNRDGTSGRRGVSE